MSADVREDVAAAVEALSAAPEETTEPTTEAAPAEVEAAPEPTETPAEKTQRERDEAGRFKAKSEAKTAAPKTEAKAETPAPVAAAPAQTPIPAPAVTTPSIKAPQSWRADVREKFAALPPEVQAEVVRRETEIAQTLQGASEPKKFFEQFKQLVGPYEGMIRAEGSDPLKAVGNLLQTAAALRTAPPEHKAQLVAQLVQSYDIPIEALAAALDGKAPAAQGRPQPQVDPTAIAQQVRQQLMQEFQQKQFAESTQKAEAWAQDKEFIEDVRVDAANILEVYARSGRALTLDQAYDMACRNHPEVSKVLEQREAAKKSAESVAAATKARAAGSSVKSQPAVAPAIESSGGSAADDVRAAIAALSGR